MDKEIVEESKEHVSEPGSVPEMDLSTPDSQTENPASYTENASIDEKDLVEFASKAGLDDTASQTTEEDDDGSDQNVSLSDHEKSEIMAAIEAVLFMSDRPVSLPKLRSIINPDVSLGTFRHLMARLRENFALDFRGVEIAEVSLGFQLRTKPHMSSVLRRMVKTQPLKLSPTNMEVLAIVAYKQPVTKDELDQIRGVDNGYVLKNLMEKRLVRICGRSDLPGKPMLYGTTHEFLELFSLKDLKSLPPLHEVEAMVAQSEVGTEEKAEKVLQEFSKLMGSQNSVLFDDSTIDAELESIRQEIASVSTTTDFIEEQKHKEKVAAQLAQNPTARALVEQGLSDEDALKYAAIAKKTEESYLAQQIDPAEAKTKALEEAIVVWQAKQEELARLKAREEELIAAKAAQEQAVEQASQEELTKSDSESEEPLQAASDDEVNSENNFEKTDELASQSSSDELTQRDDLSAGQAEQTDQEELNEQLEQTEQDHGTASLQAAEGFDPEAEPEAAEQSTEGADNFGTEAQTEVETADASTSLGRPSPELEAQAEAATWERHTEMISKAIQESHTLEPESQESRKSGDSSKGSPKNSPEDSEDVVEDPTLDV